SHFLTVFTVILSYKISSSSFVPVSSLSYDRRLKASSKLDSPFTYSKVVLHKMSANPRFHLTILWFALPFTLAKYFTDKLADCTISCLPTIKCRNLIVAATTASISFSTIVQFASLGYKLCL